MNCSYKKCRNAYWACKKENKDLHFFRFPLDEHICRLWIDMCDRPDLLNKDIRSLHNYRVCSEHFGNEMFMNPNQKTRLLPSAVPQKYGAFLMENLSNEDTERLSPAVSVKIEDGDAVDEITDCVDELDLINVTGDQFELLEDVTDTGPTQTTKNANEPFTNTSPPAYVSNILRNILTSTGENTVQHPSNTGVNMTLNDLSSSCIGTSGSYVNGGIPLPGIYTGSTGTPLTNGGIHNQSGYNSQTAFVIDFDADNFKITNSKIPDKGTTANSEGAYSVTNDHDYVKQGDPRANEENSYGNVYLTINLTQYSKVIDVKKISGVVLLLKEDPILHVNLNDVNIPKPNTIKNTLQNAAMIPKGKEKIGEEIQVLKQIIDLDQTMDSSEQTTADKENERQYFECPQCVSGFYSQQVLKNHIRKVHTLDFKYKCSACPKKYNSEAAFMRHETEKHYIHCDFCEESFKLIIEYKKHLRESHKEVFPNNCKPYYCEECNLRFGNKTSVIKHLRFHGDVLCQLCLERFPNKESYKAHLDVHPDLYKCDKCDRRFKSKPSLVAHNNTHNDPFSAVCGECKRGFKTMQEVKAHIKNHHRKVNRYMCDKCPKIFATKHSLVRHVQTKHEGIEIDIKCPDCDRIFKSDSGLKLHRDNFHLKLKPYQCEYCGKQFGRKDFMLQHVKIHLRPPARQRKPWSIKFIREETDQKNGRGRRYKYTAPPVDCHICGKHIKSAINLPSHLLSHTRERKFKCRYCGITFMHPYTKTRHERTHEAEPNKFICPVCWKRLDSQEELDSHLKNHKRPPRHKCDICNETFFRKHLLEDHVHSKHDTEKKCDNEVNQELQEELEQQLKILDVRL